MPLYLAYVGIGSIISFGAGFFTGNGLSGLGTIVKWGVIGAVGYVIYERFLK